MWRRPSNTEASIGKSRRTDDGRTGIHFTTVSKIACAGRPFGNPQGIAEFGAGKPENALKFSRIAPINETGDAPTRNAGERSTTKEGGLCGSRNTYKTNWRTS
jgi:hypothetical protein